MEIVETKVGEKTYYSIVDRFRVLLVNGLTSRNAAEKKMYELSHA